MRALVIGADGFAGRWLVRHLTASGDDVSAVVGPNFQASSGLADQVDPVGQLDIRDAGSVTALVEARSPDVVYNLAGISRQGEREEVSEAVGVSVVGSVNVLVACARLSPAPRLVFVSTGYVYRAGSEPVDEESPLDPDSMYASAKLAAERALRTIGPAAGVEVVIARPFNHIGPGQSEAFLVPTLASQVAAAVGDAGSDVIRVADPSVVRDFTDVRDVVAGYRILAARAAAGGVYNIASGVGVSVADLARTIASVVGIHVRLEDTGMAPRRNDPRVLIGDARRLESLGWHRDYSLRATLADVIRPYVSEARSAR